MATTSETMASLCAPAAAAAAAVALLGEVRFLGVPLAPGFLLLELLGVPLAAEPLLAVDGDPLVSLGLILGVPLETLVAPVPGEAVFDFFTGTLTSPFSPSPSPSRTPFPSPSPSPCFTTASAPAAASDPTLALPLLGLLDLELLRTFFDEGDPDLVAPALSLGLETEGEPSHFGFALLEDAFGEALETTPVWATATSSPSDSAPAAGLGALGTAGGVQVEAPGAGARSVELPVGV